MVATKDVSVDVAVARTDIFTLNERHAKGTEGFTWWITLSLHTGLALAQFS